MMANGAVGPLHPQAPTRVSGGVARGFGGILRSAFVAAPCLAIVVLVFAVLGGADSVAADPAAGIQVPDVARSVVLARVPSSRATAWWMAGTVVGRDRDVAYVLVPFELHEQAAAELLQPVRTVDVLVNPGTRNEHLLEGRIVDEDESAGMMLVAMAGPNVPPPVPLSVDRSVMPGQPLVAVGFGFSSIKSTLDRSHTQATFAPCHFWESRRDGHEAAATGLAEAGFRGGAVVDAEGRLVGVVQKVSNSEALIRMVGDAYIRNFVGPGIGDVKATHTVLFDGGGKGTSKRGFRIETQVHDPGSRIVLLEARIVFVDSRTSLGPDEHGEWPRYEPVVGAEAMSVKPGRRQRGGWASATVSATWSLAPTEVALAQVMFTTSNGEVHYSTPVRLP